MPALPRSAVFAIVGVIAAGGIGLVGLAGNSAATASPDYRPRPTPVRLDSTTAAAEAVADDEADIRPDSGTRASLTERTDQP